MATTVQECGGIARQILLFYLYVVWLQKCQNTILCYYTLPVQEAGGVATQLLIPSRLGLSTLDPFKRNNQINHIISGEKIVFLLAFLQRLEN